MARPRGYIPSQASRDKQSASIRRSLAERRARAEISNSILAAVADGDVDRASAIYHEYADARNAETEMVMGPALMGLRQADYHDMTAEIVRDSEAGRAETAELLFARRVQKMLMEYVPKSAHVADAEIAIARKVMLNMVRDLHPDRSADEAQDAYKYIPSIQERAMMRNQRNNAGTGRLENAASTPWVSEHETRHMPMTGTHTHDHSAYGEGDHDDGLHLHEHQHHGDALHNHHPSQPGPAHRPGKGE